jgi:6,7-dimethyl-8-ribityllumazine synthase
MPKTYEGRLGPTDARFALVVSRFNSLFSDQLLAGALDGLRRHGVADDHVEIVWVPGAIEIPLLARRLAQTGRFAAIVALGAVIRGATPHFDHVCRLVSNGCAEAARDSGVPVIFGVLTTDSLEQAMERAGTKAGNKGHDAATAALEMVDLLRQLPQGR